MDGVTALPLCPTCSVFRLRHPELSRDVISRPQLRETPAGFYVTSGCAHAAPVFGPHDTAEAANAAWEVIVAPLAVLAGEAKRADILDYEEREAKDRATAFTLGANPRHPLLQ